MASWAPTDPQEVARWVRTRRRNWRDHVDRMEHDRWASWAPTDPQEVARWVRTRRRAKLERPRRQNGTG
jgi:hypothetical protein